MEVFKILNVILLIKSIISDRINEKIYASETLNEVNRDLRYFPTFLRADMSTIWCGAECLKLEECMSFYVTEGVCVLGVTNATNFDENEEIFPEKNQVIKGRLNYCSFSLKFLKN